MDQGLIVELILGLIAGVAAMSAIYRTVPDDITGWITALIIGLVGGWLGGWVADRIGLTQASWVGSLVVAFAGAAIILYFLRSATGKTL